MSASSPDSAPVTAVPDPPGPHVGSIGFSLKQPRKLTTKVVTTNAPLPSQREAAYQALLDYTLMARVDRQGIYRDYQVPAGFEAIGTPATVIGRHLSEVLPPALAQQRLEQIQQTLATGAVQYSEYQLPLADTVRTRSVES